jgi:hypothetical protein
VGIVAASPLFACSSAPLGEPGPHRQSGFELQVDETLLAATPSTEGAQLLQPQTTAPSPGQPGVLPGDPAPAPEAEPTPLPPPGGTTGEEPDPIAGAFGCDPTVVARDQGYPNFRSCASLQCTGGSLRRPAPDRNVEGASGFVEVLAVSRGTRRTSETSSEAIRGCSADLTGCG